MMPATKSSWRGFVPLLVQKGYHVLAIDLRGHGESDGGPDGYQQFSDQEHEGSIRDIEGAVDFLKQRGVDVARLTLIGASIGANLAVAFMALHHEIKTGVLLSAGTKYRGVDALHAIRDIVPSQRLFFVSSKDDIGSYGSNYDMNVQLMTALNQEVLREWVLYSDAGHGTNMFGKEEPDLAEKITEWVNKS
jgi:pimeloyl-ACP methyl ester carboxylesterase